MFQEKEITPELLQAPDIFDEETDSRVEVLRKVFSSNKVIGKFENYQQEIPPEELSYYLFTGISNGEHPDVLVVSHKAEIQGGKMETDIARDRTFLINCSHSRLTKMDIKWWSSGLRGSVSIDNNGGTQGPGNGYFIPLITADGEFRNRISTVVNPGQTVVVLADCYLDRNLGDYSGDFVLDAPQI